MKLKKIVSLLLVSALSISCMFSMAGCKSTDSDGKKVDSDEENVINIYALKKGYGLDWLDALIEGFEEKYPEYEVHYKWTVEDKAILNELDMDETVYDLLISGSTCASDIAKQLKGTVNKFESLKGVYESTPDGESTTVKDKMSEEVHDLFAWETESGDTDYYTFPWAGGANALLYHDSVFKEVFGENYQLPRTSDELLEVCNALTKAGKVPFILSSNADSYYFMYETWWAQYEGMESVTDFYDGKYYDEEEGMKLRGVKCFKQDGRTAAINTLNQFVGKDSAYVYEGCEDLSWQNVQTYFMDERVAMFPNGDWNNIEMSKSFPDNSVRMMRVPVVSDLADKLGITEDNLRDLIDYVDGVKKEVPAFSSSVGMSSEEVIASVTEARKLVFSFIGDFTACVPQKSNAKEAAKKFLTYMASDEGLKAYAKVQQGLTLPFNYDMKADEALYASFNDFSKSVIDIMSDCVIYRQSYKTVLSRTYMIPFREEMGSSIEIKLYTGSMTAQDIIDSDYNYYTKNNNQAWNKLLKDAGL